MSWMQQLYETYERCARNPDLQTGERPLLPIYHSSQQAHIEAVLNECAEFVGAKVIEKVETILPATEESAGRTSGEAPHALADKIQYCAGDYKDFGGQKKAYFQSYITQLEQWCNSEYSHKKVKIIYEYLKKKTLVDDLVRIGVLYVGAGRCLLDDWKNGETEQPAIFKQLQKDSNTKKYDQGNALVRWRVQIPGDFQENATWLDQTVYDSWRRYCVTLDNTLDICHISGRNQPVATNHPRRIRNSGDGAKIISIPVDETFYTFKGRFVKETEACAVGVEISQKAHNALRWLISRQGYRNGDQVIVSWAVSGKEVPKITDNSLDFLGNELEQTEEAFSSDVGQRFALKLNKKIAGYQQELGSSEKIVVIGLDSASKGRLSISFYRELTGSEFLKHVENWHLDFAWLLCYFIKNQSKKTRQVWRTCAPSPKSIAEAAYGKRLDDKLKKTTVERLLPCIVDGNPLPPDLLESCVKRTSNRVSMEDWEWQQSLGISCALYKGYYTRISDTNQRRLYKMALERERKSRDYLFGRLLAVAEQIEGYALYKSNEKRITSAERLMLRFSSHPCSTWKTIEESLRPYKDRLRASSDAGLLHYWEAEIEQVCSLIEFDDFISDKPLSGEYLLGYHCQKLYKKLKAKESIEESNGSESFTEGQL
ncbi:type I-C CRISPR-associated protein Cas8c/Csd1 [bacterium]|nr:type I-C CRISPR-associated protein Cas8c/Csd1 [bacterium]